MPSGLESAWEGVKREFEAARDDARSALTRELNEILRRFRHYSGESEWLSIVLDAMELFTPEAAVFGVSKERLELRAQRGLTLADAYSLDAPFPHAFSNALSSKDAAVVLPTAGEVGPRLAATDAAKRAVLAPVLNSARVVAVLFASNDMDVQAAELIAGIAGLALERRSNSDAALRIAPAASASPSPSASAQSKPTSLPPWSRLSEAERTRHIRAQRFARIRVAEMLLAQPEAARAGREQNNVYLFLRNPVDAARESYRTQFLDTGLGIDYLHLELVRAAADGKEESLGADYPGPLV